jgi:hypothetical protein
MTHGTATGTARICKDCGRDCTALGITFYTTLRECMACYKRRRRREADYAERDRAASRRWKNENRERNRKRDRDRIRRVSLSGPSSKTPGNQIDPGAGANRPGSGNQERGS